MRSAPRLVRRLGIADEATSGFGPERPGSAAIVPRVPQVDTPPQAAPESLELPNSHDFMIEVDGQLVPNYDATIVSFSEGDVVTGKVVRIDKDEVLVDIGYKSEGVIPQNELSIRRSIDPAEEVQLGEEVDALVLTKEDQDGRLILSKKRARFERAWRRIEAAAESGEPVEGTVIEVVKGGLIIDLGVRGFLPASLVDIRRVQNLDEYLGQKIECKVIELNRSRNNVVLSRRAVLEEERKEARQQILDRLQRGEVVEGTISNIVDFGAFVDLDGIDGLIHISELSWGHVNHPSEVLNDRRDGAASRCSTSTATASASRSASSRPRRTRGSGSCAPTTSATCSRARSPRSSASARSSRSWRASRASSTSPSSRSTTSRTRARSSSPGDEVKVKILEIDEERRRLSLSLKRVEGQVLPRPRACRRSTDDDQEDGEQDVPDLGLSEEVFAPRPSAPRRRLPRRRRPQPSGRGRGPPRPSGRGRSRAEAEEPAPRPTSSRPRRQQPEAAPAAEPEPSRRPRSRPTPVALRRLDRRHRLRQVRGARRLRAPRARRRCPATPSCTSCSAPTRCATCCASAGASASLDGRRGRPRGRRRDRVRAAGGAGAGSRACCSRASASGSRPGGRSSSAATTPPEIAVVEVPLLFEAGIEGVFDATIAVVADEALRARARRRARATRASAGRDGAPALAGREGAHVPTT